jgi:membrane protein implicated in regulation of membrane protease activity
MFGLEAWHVWIIVGLLLVLAELLGAGFVLLALGVACLVGAAVAGTTDLDFGWQLGLTSAAAALLVPCFVYWFRRSFVPHRGVVGEGGGQGERVRLIEHSGRIGLKHKGDFFPARAIDGKPLRAGDEVEIQSFEGITALVAPCLD